MSKVTLPAPFAFWVAAAVVAHTLWTSAAPAMVYPIYARQWGVTPTITTALFAVYPLVVAAVLVLFADISDQIGRRLAMLLGLAGSAAGVALFAVANDLTTLFIGRIFMGVGVGLSAGPSVAALVDNAGKNGVGRASAATIVGQSVGFSAALLVGGALVTYAPWPTHLSFAILAVLILALMVLCFLLPNDRPSSLGRWRPRVPHVPRRLRGVFALAALAVMAAYTHGVIITSLGAQIAHDLIRSDNPFVNSIALALFAIALGVAGLSARNFSANSAVVLGAVASIVGLASLTAAVAGASLVWFELASAISGVGYAFLVYGGLALIGSATVQAERGGAMSMLFVLAYLFTAMLAVSLGKLATMIDLGTAVLTGATVLSALCVAVVLLVLVHRRSTASTTP